MASNESTAAEDALIGDAPEVLPLFWTKEATEPASLVGAELERLFAAAGYPQLFIRVESADAAVQVMRSPQLSTRLHPCSLWENQPVWLVRMQTGAAGDDDLIDALLLPVNFFALPGGLPSAGPRETSRGISFCFDPGHASAPALTQQAFVLAYFIFSAWLNFWQSRTGTLHEAFALEEPGREYCLGLSWVGPSWEAVIAERSGPVLGELRKRWVRKTEAPSQTPCPNLDELVRAAVPDRGYRVVTVEKDSSHVRLDNGEEKLWLEMTEQLRMRRKLGWERRLGELLEIGQQVASFSIRNAVRWAETRLAKRFRKVGEDLAAYLNPFSETHPDRACLSAIDERIRYLRSRLDKLEDLDVETCFTVRSLEENIAGLRQKILGLPVLKSVFLRLGLIGVGCAWLFLGGMLWMRGAFTAMDYAVRVQTGWVIGGAYLLLLLLVFGRWGWYHLGIHRFEGLTLRDICADAARSLAKAISNSTTAEIRTVRMRLNGRAYALQGLKEALEEDWPALPGQADAATPDPRFPPEKLDAFFQSRFEATVRDTEDRFQARMGDRDFTLEPVVWMEQAQSSVRASLRGIVDALPFEDVAETCALTKDDRKNLIQQTMRNARNMLADRFPDSRPRGLIFLAQSWQQCLAEFDTTILRDDPVARNGLMGVCAVPVQENGGAA